LIIAFLKETESNSGIRRKVIKEKKENAMKQIIISVAGAEGKRDFKDVQILPGTKPRDVLTQLNLTGFQLSKPEGGAFGFNDDLYQGVSDGQKVFATKADVEAGNRR
jgi:hypothetical protein